VWIYINDVLRGDYPFPGKRIAFGNSISAAIRISKHRGRSISDLKIYTADTEMFFEDQTHRHNLIGLGDPDFSVMDSPWATSTAMD
jgi:hypothetical protein